MSAEPAGQHSHHHTCKQERASTDSGLHLTAARKVQVVLPPTLPRALQQRFAFASRWERIITVRAARAPRLRQVTSVRRQTRARVRATVNT